MIMCYRFYHEGKHWPGKSLYTISANFVIVCNRFYHEKKHWLGKSLSSNFDDSLFRIVFLVIYITNSSICRMEKRGIYLYLVGWQGVEKGFVTTGLEKASIKLGVLNIISFHLIILSKIMSVKN